MSFEMTYGMVEYVPVPLGVYKFEKTAGRRLRRLGYR